MKRINLFGILGILLISSACADDNGELLTIEQGLDEIDSLSREFCINTIAEYVATHNGTICCVSGVDEASPGEILDFEYHSNLDFTSVEWTIVSGAISVVEGQNSSIVTFEFGSDFTEGTIHSVGITAIGLKCGGLLIFLKNST